VRAAGIGNTYFNGTRIFNNVFTRAHHWTVSWGSYIKPTRTYIVWPWSVLVSTTRSSHWYVLSMRATCLAHHILLGGTLTLLHEGSDCETASLFIFSKFLLPPLFQNELPPHYCVTMLPCTSVRPASTPISLVHLELRGRKWQEAGEDCIMKSFITCTLHQILLGW
jgi:hypothetical protein